MTIRASLGCFWMTDKLEQKSHWVELIVTVERSFLTGQISRGRAYISIIKRDFRVGAFTPLFPL
jgi:hypothetical protein